MNMFNIRQNHMGLYSTYFYTETIQNFSNLLANDNLKMIVIDSLKYLVKNELIKLYGYVIMPNHIHLLWSILKMNGNETPSGSFSKYTAHEFRKYYLSVGVPPTETIRIFIYRLVSHQPKPLENLLFLQNEHV